MLKIPKLAQTALGSFQELSWKELLVPVTLSRDWIHIPKSSSSKKEEKTGSSGGVKIATFRNRAGYTMCGEFVTGKGHSCSPGWEPISFFFYFLFLFCFSSNPTEWWKKPPPCALLFKFFSCFFLFPPRRSFVYLDNKLPAGLSGTSRFFYSHHGVARYSSSLCYMEPHSMHHTWIIKICHRRSNACSLSHPLALSLSPPFRFRVQFAQSINNSRGNKMGEND